MSEEEQSSLDAGIRSVELDGDELVIVVRLSNPSSRALYYISDVRTTKLDPASKRLTVGLSDEGREVIPGVIARMPVFKYVDPESEAELELRIPARIVKLSRSAPPGELAFETQQLDELEEVVAEVAWADVPYYKDLRRDKDDMRLPAARWQQQKCQASLSVKVERK